MAEWDSLLNSLNTAVLGVFGREIEYLPQNGGALRVRAIFQQAHEAEESSPGVYGVVFVRLCDLPVAPQAGDRLVTGTSIYTVYQVESDGSGAATLYIRVQS